MFFLFKHFTFKRLVKKKKMKNFVKLSYKLVFSLLNLLLRCRVLIWWSVSCLINIIMNNDYDPNAFNKFSINISLTIVVNLKTS